MHVAEIMTEEVATADAKDSLADCARTMLSEGAGSVVVVDGDRPIGIVTESDILRAGIEADEPLSALPVRANMSSPIKWVRPGLSTRVAAEKMREERVKKLVVVEDMEMVGIVTVTDIVFRLSDVAQDIGDVVGLREKWDSDRRFR
ncbi:hypothetical protein C440_03203 [Haloferax mucosum ATCC BAA-1512]|uniref:CBS domain-containing protein n=1 Tax=Haloferax mucosum ATCC BAA-1512 TaxID=662479 RepID=M0ILL3_9EURY|nr:CBS domain-containing protein [Haloferax mucosum]ELZ96748.1 hypothetical protein C440_03203 [Haloferax mucosum ATCC BAA-1512]